MSVNSQDFHKSTETPSFEKANVLFKPDNKQNQLNSVWSYIKNSASWWLVVFALIGFLGIVVAFTPRASHLLLTFLAIPFLALLFFALFSLLSDSTQGQLYQTLFEQNNEGIFIGDLQGNIIDVNQRVCAMFGYTKAELLQLSFRDVIASAAVPEAESVLQKLLKGEAVPLYERLARHKDGTLIPVEVSARLIRDRHGNPQHIQSIIRDVTERKRIEQAIISSEKRLRAFAESLPDRAVILDRDGNYRDVLKSGATLQLVNTEFVKRNVAEIFEPEFADFCKKMVQKALDENARQSIEYTFKFEQQEQYLEGHITPLSDPETGEQVVMWVTRDVTERKHSEQALKNSEALLRTFAETLPDRVVILDKDGYYRDVLKQRYDRSNFQPAPQNATGKTLYDVLTKDFADFCLKIVRQTLDVNTTQVLEYTQTIGGQVVHFEGRVAPFNDPKTGERLVMWVSRNITERIQAEEQHLELTVEREKLAFLRDFVDSIVHDLKTPLTVVRTSLNLLERSKDENKRQARIAGIYTQVDIITQMLDDLLAMARLDNLPNLPMATVDLQVLIEEIMVYLRPKAEHQSQQIHIDIGTDTLNMLAAEDELRRALTNLIDNAIKYTPEHGTVSVRVACEDDGTVIEVKDTGIGIKAEDLPHLFDRFFRSDNAKSHATGTGLGLAITKRIIELHGGHITVESQYQLGSIFRVWLPPDLGIASV